MKLENEPLEEEIPNLGSSIFRWKNRLFDPMLKGPCEVEATAPPASWAPKCMKNDDGVFQP